MPFPKLKANSLYFSIAKELRVSIAGPLFLYPKCKLRKECLFLDFVKPLIIADMEVSISQSRIVQPQNRFTNSAKIGFATQRTDNFAIEVASFIKRIGFE